MLFKHVIMTRKDNLFLRLRLTGKIQSQWLKVEYAKPYENNRWDWKAGCCPLYQEHMNDIICDARDRHNAVTSVQLSNNLKSLWAHPFKGMNSGALWASSINVERIYSDKMVGLQGGPFIELSKYLSQQLHLEL